MKDWSADSSFTNPGRDSKGGGKGNGLHLCTIVPVAGGVAAFALYYNTAKADDYVARNRQNMDCKVNSYGAVGRYKYSLSKRTPVYTASSNSTTRQTAAISILLLIKTASRPTSAPATA